MATLTVLVLLGLGTARLTALVSKDDITAGLRDMIWHWSPPTDDERRGLFYQQMRKATKQERADRKASVSGLPWYYYWFVNVDKPRKAGFVGEAISCPLCISVWIAAANYAAWELAPTFTYNANTFLAIAFIGGFLAAKHWK